MGWTKHGDAILAHKDRLVEVRAELRKISGNLRDPATRKYAVGLLREHEGLRSALAYGHRDGTIKAELGVSLNYTHKDLGLIVRRIIEYGPEVLTFRRRS